MEESLLPTVTASFETAFEVDKEVAAAVKVALVGLKVALLLVKMSLKNCFEKLVRILIQVKRN